MQPHPCLLRAALNGLGSQHAASHSLLSSRPRGPPVCSGLPRGAAAATQSSLVNTLATILSRPGVRLKDAPASFFAGTALGGTGRFGSYAAPQVSPDPSH